MESGRESELVHLLYGLSLNYCPEVKCLLGSNMYFGDVAMKMSHKEVYIYI